MPGITEILIFIRLLAAHILADFVFQSKSWIEDRTKHLFKSKYLYFHIGILGILTYLFLADWNEFIVPAIIMVTHLFIDIWKSKKGDTAFYFILDQSAHLLVLIAAWLYYIDGFFDMVPVINNLLSSSGFWIVSVGYLMVIWPVGFLIANITTRWQQEIANEEQESLSGLQNAGMWIGRLERFIIMTLILLNQFSAIGFLIAAKSIFRFRGRINTPVDRKEAEYILIGTLLSFSIAIILGVIVTYLLRVLP